MGRRRPRSLAIGVAALMLLVAVFGLVFARSAFAGPVPTLEVGPNPVAGADTVKLADQTWVNAESNLVGIGDRTSVHVPIPASVLGADNVAMANVEVVVDTATTTVSMRGTLESTASVFSPDSSTEVLVVLQWQAVSDTTPDIAVTVKSRGEKLASFLGGDPDSLPGNLSIPDFSGTVGRSSLPADDSNHISRPGNLPPAAVAFYEEIYGPGGLPLNNIGPLENLGDALFATASMPAADLGETASDLFGFTPGTTFVFEGSLNRGLDKPFNPTLGDWGMQVILPQFTLPDSLDFLSLADSTAGFALAISYDDDTNRVKLAATADMTTDLFGNGEPFELELAFGAGFNTAVPAPPAPACPAPAPAPGSDDDGDGVSNADEVADGTDPNDEDTDGDGRCDGQEKTDGTDPLDRDTDEDEVEDGSEATLGTDPNDKDTDNDGLDDGEELATFMTDPTDADSDDDGTNDGDEDADGDGIANKNEPKPVKNLDIEISLRAEMQGEWTQPYGIDFITVNKLKLTGSFTRALNDAGVVQNTYKGELSGDVLLGGELFKVRIKGELKGGSPSAEIRLDYADQMSVTELLEPLGLALDGAPSELTDTMIGPVFVQASVEAGVVQLYATGTLEIQVEGLTIGVTGMFGANTDGDVIVGVRPSSDLTLRDLLPANLASEVSDDANFAFSRADGSASFGFVYTNATGGLVEKSNKLPTGVRDFFKPLVGRVDSDKTIFDLEIPQGLSVLASFELPDAIGEAVETIGLQSRVSATGTLPFGSGQPGADLKLSMAIKTSLLPEFVKSVTGSLFVEVDTSGLKIGLEGDARLRFRAGLPEELASIPVAQDLPLTIAEPVSPDFPCANGTEPQVSDLSEDAPPANAEYYCFDELKTTLSGAIDFQASGVVELSLTGAVSTPQPDTVWNPFGIEFVGIDSLRLTGAVAVSSGLDVGLKLGLAADFEWIDNGNAKDMTFAGQVSGSLTANAPYVKIKPDGLRWASGEGFAISDLVRQQNAWADEFNKATGANVPLISLDDIQIPNLGLRNLDFSFGATDLTDLCIPQGLVIRADLYVNAGGDAPVRNPSCDTSGPSPTTIVTEDTCNENFDQGCLASGVFVVSSSGFTASLVGADINVVPLSLGPIVGELTLTATDQRLLLQAEGEVANFLDPGAGPLIEGDLMVAIRPTEVDIFGSVDLFGFNALLDIKTSLGLFSGTVPEFRFQVLMATDQADLGQPAWSSLVFGESEPILEVVATVGVVAGELLETLERTGDPLQVFGQGPAAMEAAGIEVPEWLVVLNDEAADTLKLLRDLGVSDVEDILLNGTDPFTIPGIPGIRIDISIDLGPLGSVGIDECLFVEVNDTCYSVPPIAIPRIAGVCDLAFPAAEFPELRVGGKCSFDRIVRDVFLPVFEEVISEVTGSDFELEDIIELVEDAFLSDRPLVDFTCAEFILEATSQSQRVSMTLDAEVFSQPAGFQFEFDFSDPVASALAMTPELVLQGLNPQASTCEGLDNNLFGFDPPPPRGEGVDGIVASIVFEERTIVEGDTASLLVTFKEPLAADTVFTLAWGDVFVDPDRPQGYTQTIPAGTTTYTITNLYPDDVNLDRDEATARDTYQVALKLFRLGEVDPTLDTASITVVNADPVIDPSTVAVFSNGEIVDSIVEGGRISYVRFAGNDLGKEAAYTYWIDWGDGTVDSGRTSRLSGPRNTQTVQTGGHTYRDDDPTGTPEDTYIITMRLYDDDTGYGEYQYELVVRNAPPSELFLSQLDADGEVSDAEIEEGASVRFGFETTDYLWDSITYTIDWGDGSALETITRPNGDWFSAPHQFIDDNPTATPVDNYLITVTATDDDLGAITGTLPVTVVNVAPTMVELSADTIDEFGTTSLSGGFRDPSPTDTYEVLVDWGDGTTEVVVVGPGVRVFGATHQYGDNGDYTITAVVTDDDTGVSEPLTTITTVNNIDPTLELDLSGAFESPSGLVLLSDVINPVILPGLSTDPGSDDLLATWTWGDGVTTESIDLVNPPEADPELSPSVQPRDTIVTNEYVYPAACLYTASLEVTDDDGGLSPSASVPVVVVGNEARSTPGGNWAAQYRRGADSTLECYLLIVEFMSATFGEVIPFATSADAEAALSELGGGSDEAARSRLRREVTAAWLNYASGAAGVTATGSIDLDYLTLLTAAESVFNDPTASPALMRDTILELQAAQR